MAIFLNRVQQLYAVNTYNVQGTIPDGSTVSSIKVSLTRVAWPPGPVGIVTLVYPGGDTSGLTFSGGDLLNKDGSPMLATTAQFYPRGNTKYPAGIYSLVFQVLQPVDSAVKIEWF